MIIKNIEVTSCRNCPFSQFHSDLDLATCTETCDNVDEYFENNSSPKNCPLKEHVVHISLKEI